MSALFMSPHLLNLILNPSCIQITFHKRKESFNKTDVQQLKEDKFEIYNYTQ